MLVILDTQSNIHLMLKIANDLRGDLNTGIFFPSADTIAFTEGGSEAMRITSDGRLGIGGTTPGVSLGVVGGIQARGGVPGAGNTNNNGFSFSGGSGDTDGGMFSSADGQIEFYTNADERMRIINGRLGIGTTNPLHKLSVDGAIAAKGINGSMNPFLSVTTGGSAVSFSVAGLIFVQGGIPSNDFNDLVLIQSFGGISVISSATFGSPSTRTYSQSGGALTIALSGGTAGTYNVRHIQIIA